MDNLQTFLDWLTSFKFEISIISVTAFGFVIGSGIKAIKLIIDRVRGKKTTKEVVNDLKDIGKDLENDLKKLMENGEIKNMEELKTALDKYLESKSKVNNVVKHQIHKFKEGLPEFDIYIEYEDSGELELLNCIPKSYVKVELPYHLLGFNCMIKDGVLIWEMTCYNVVEGIIKVSNEHYQ